MANPTLMQLYTEYNDRLKAEGIKLIAFSCPSCNESIETRPAPKGDTWDTLSNCPHCGSMFMKITKGKKAYGLTSGIIEVTVRTNEGEDKTVPASDIADAQKIAKKLRTPDSYMVCVVQNGVRTMRWDRPAVVGKNQWRKEDPGAFELLGAARPMRVVRSRTNVTIDTADLEQVPKSTADAILANVKTSMLLKAGQPVAKDEFWDAVGEGEVRQFNRERVEQHDEQASRKASRSPKDTE